MKKAGVTTLLLIYTVFLLTGCTDAANTAAVSAATARETESSNVSASLITPSATAAAQWRSILPTLQLSYGYTIDELLYTQCSGDLMYQSCREGQWSETTMLAGDVEAFASFSKNDDESKHRIYLDSKGTLSDADTGEVIFQDVSQLVSTVNSHAVLLTNDGTVWAMGNDDNGECGDLSSNVTRRQNDGGDYWHETPVEVMSGCVEVAAGAYYSAALTEGGSLYLWGDNSYGQIGNGECGNGYPTIATDIVPKPTLIMENVAHVTLYDFNSFALKNDGTVWAWGEAYGSSPMQIGSGFIDVLGGEFALYADGSITYLDDPNTVVSTDVADALLNGNVYPAYIAVLHTDGKLELIYY